MDGHSKRGRSDRSQWKALKRDIMRTRDGQHCSSNSINDDFKNYKNNRILSFFARSFGNTHFSSVSHISSSIPRNLDQIQAPCFGKLYMLFGGSRIECFCSKLSQQCCFVLFLTTFLHLLVDWSFALCLGNSTKDALRMNVLFWSSCVFVWDEISPKIRIDGYSSWGEATRKQLKSTKGLKQNSMFNIFWTKNRFRLEYVFSWSFSRKMPDCYSG